MTDLIRSLQHTHAGREPERLQLKYRAMRSNPFVFLRGTCALFYQRLPVKGVFRSAPLAWSCGDLHFENFGSYKADNGLVYFDINDFDEAVLAPLSWDLVRFLASVLVAARTLSISKPEAGALCKEFISAYATALATGKSRWIERDTAQGLVRALLDDLRGRKRADFLDTRTEHKGKRRRLRIDGRKALPATIAQQRAVRKLMRTFAATQPNPAFYKVRDIARRIAGTGSLGVERYVILVEGKGSPDGNVLLDLKQALPASLLDVLEVAQPPWKNDARRTVMLQQRLQAIPMAFLHPVRMGKQHFILRGLQPSEDRVTLDRAHQSMPQLQQVMREMGNLLAWAHLRGAGRAGSANADALVAYGQRQDWQAPLIARARASAVQVRKDWQAYRSAYDAGVFT